MAGPLTALELVILEQTNPLRALVWFKYWTCPPCAYRLVMRQVQIPASMPDFMEAPVRCDYCGEHLHFND
jgi:DNA-directed RNA polymerase subunit RPC12/RpoP